MSVHPECVADSKQGILTPQEVIQVEVRSEYRVHDNIQPESVFYSRLKILSSHLPNRYREDK